MSWDFDYHVEIKCYNCGTPRVADDFVTREPHTETGIGCKDCGTFMNIHFPVWKTIWRQEGPISVRIVPLP